MSWFSDNYEKVCLGGAAVIAAGLCYGVLKGGEDPFVIDPVKTSNDATVPGLDQMNRVKKSLAESHEIHQSDVDGRKVDLFTGVALYARKNDSKNPVDLGKSKPVHPPIPNSWWEKYKLDPGFSNSPQLDPDEDGFTNLEEFNAGTDPTDFKLFPNPIDKLKLVERKTTQVHLKPLVFGPGQFTFRLENKLERVLNRMNPQPIGPGAIIPFRQPLMNNRFKFLKTEEKQNARIGGMDTIWLFEDQKPNKKGDIYRFDSRGRLDGLNDRSRGIMDTKVKLLLQALKQGGNPFEIDEGTHFSLPYDPEAKVKPYFLRKIDLDKKQAEVEYKDKNGNKKVHTMPFQ